MRPLRVEIWSDIACPWCWVGKRHLETAKARFPHPVQVLWRSFELDPHAPRSVDPSIDYVERLARKYRATREAAQGMIDRMTGVGAADGLDFRFDRIKPGNTFDAHRLLSWAAERGRQDALKERLFLAYMHEGRSVADHGELAALAADVGLPSEEARAVLEEGRYTDEVRADEALAAELGVTGVPFFVFEEHYAASGAQPAELLLQAMQRAWNERPEVTEASNTGTAVASSAAGDEHEAAPTEACGPDGCTLPST
jgi:predicted DsbA family dithiol-disulfide isomerase